MTQPSNVVPLPGVRVPAAATITFARGDEVELAEQLVNQICADGPVTSDEGEVWRYRAQGTWEAIPRAELKTIVANYAGSPILAPKPKLLNLSNRAIDGTIKISYAMLEVSPDHLRFKDGIPGIGFGNGYLRTEGGVLKGAAHSPFHMARHAFGFNYEAAATHPRLDQFFAEVFADAQPWDAVERVRLLQEFVGACLIGQATTLQRTLLLYGSGSNGKSAFLDIIGSVFPPGSTCALAPQDWGSRFRTAGLVGKLANIVNEVPENEIVANALFKSVISGEPIQAENKGLTPFTFRPVAGHMFAANSLPATSDQSFGFWRRFLVVPFTRDMSQVPTRRPNIAKEIVDAELPGIVAWAVEGAARVIAQGAYSHCQASDDAIDRWRMEVDPVLHFVKEECVANPTAQTSAKVLYDRFKVWAVDNGFRPPSSTKFGRRLKLLGIRPDHTRTGNVYRLAFCNLV
jgi:P4 family phage/plasmid primase-like protien